MIPEGAEQQGLLKLPAGLLNAGPRPAVGGNAATVPAPFDRFARGRYVNPGSSVIFIKARARARGESEGIFVSL